MAEKKNGKERRVWRIAIRMVTRRQDRRLPYIRHPTEIVSTQANEQIFMHNKIINNNNSAIYIKT